MQIHEGNEEMAGIEDIEDIRELPYFAKLSTSSTSSLFMLYRPARSETAAAIPSTQAAIRP